MHRSNQQASTNPNFHHHHRVFAVFWEPVTEADGMVGIQEFVDVYEWSDAGSALYVALVGNTHPQWWIPMDTLTRALCRTCIRNACVGNVQWRLPEALMLYDMVGLFPKNTSNRNNNKHQRQTYYVRSFLWLCFFFFCRCATTSTEHKCGVPMGYFRLLYEDITTVWLLTSDDRSKPLKGSICEWVKPLALNNAFLRTLV